MLKMNEAKVKIKNQDSYIIKIDEVKNHKNFHSIIDNIYCPTAECNCKLTYVNRERPYLRTFRMHEHIPECMYSKERIEEEKRKRAERVISGSLSEESLRRKQNYGFKKYFSSPQSSKNNIKKKDTTQKTNKLKKDTSKSQTITTNIVTFDDPEVVKEGTKVAPTPSIHINEVDEKYINKPINLYGVLESMDITENLITLTLKSSNNNKIILPEAYFSSTSLNNPKRFLEIIYHYFKDKNEDIPVCVTSILKKRGSIYLISVPLFSNLTFLEPGSSNTSPKDAGQLGAILSRKKLDI